jgi:hypothetical protein
VCHRGWIWHGEVSEQEGNRSPTVAEGSCGYAATGALFLLRNRSLRFTADAPSASLLSPGLGWTFLNIQFSNPASRRAKMPAAFCFAELSCCRAAAFPPRTRALARSGSWPQYRGPFGASFDNITTRDLIKSWLSGVVLVSLLSRAGLRRLQRSRRWPATGF